MLGVWCFWSAAALLSIAALSLVIIPIWHSPVVIPAPRHYKLGASITLATLLLVCIGVGYAYLGAGDHLKEFYSEHNIATRKNGVMVRPLYAALQRELVKHDLNLTIDLKNLGLILKFAQLQSEMHSGVLSKPAHDLLHAVLKSVPLQITALNLLAIHAYKAERYSEAIEYWQRILMQMNSKDQNNVSFLMLRDKINETQVKLDNIKTKAKI